MREGRIVRIHLHLRHDGRDMPALVRLVHSDTKGLLEVVADIPLAHGAALRQPHGRSHARFRGIAERVLDHADLGAIAVGNDDLVAVGDHLDKRRRDGAQARHLLFRRISQGIAAQSDDHALIGIDTHEEPPCRACQDMCQISAGRAGISQTWKTVTP